MSSEPNPRIKRVEFELRATGVKPDAANSLRSGIHTRGYLPHVKREGASYFVTFRLADSLPREVLLKIQGARAERLQRFYAQKDAADKAGLTLRQMDSVEEIERDYFRRLEGYLDRGQGACWLQQPDIA